MSKSLEDDAYHFHERNNGVMGRPIWIRFAAAALVLISLVGCSGDEASEDGTTETAPKPETPVDGSFIGKVSGTKAFVAIVVAPADDGQDERAVEVYVTDGNRVSESFSGSISDNSFVAESDDGDMEARGELSGESFAGTVELPNDNTVRYKAAPPAGAAGLYDLTVSAKGRLRGTSAGGIGVTGRIDLLLGTGVLRLADGRRLKFDVAERPGDDVPQLQAGQVRLIVLASGELRGAGTSQAASDEGSSDFFIRSQS
jgi:hypothetical protein